MTYEPKVDDYVIWKRPSGDWDEGWVYFKGDPVDNEKAKKFLSMGEISRDEKIDLVEHASWTVIAQMLLNMDETLTRG